LGTVFCDQNSSIQYSAPELRGRFAAEKEGRGRKKGKKRKEGKGGRGKKGREWISPRKKNHGYDPAWGYLEDSCGVRVPTC